MKKIDNCILSQSLDYQTFLCLVIKISIIEYCAGNLYGNIISPFPTSVSPLVILASCNHCVLKIG